jgi:hypothetical protein
MTLGKWRKHDRDLGQEDLQVEIRARLPRTYEDETVDKVSNKALESKPGGGSKQ